MKETDYGILGPREQYNVDSVAVARTAKSDKVVFHFTEDILAMMSGKNHGVESTIGLLASRVQRIQALIQRKLDELEKLEIACTEASSSQVVSDSRIDSNIVFYQLTVLQYNIPLHAALRSELSAKYDTTQPLTTTQIQKREDETFQLVVKQETLLENAQRCNIYISTS